MNKSTAKQLKESVRKQINKLKLERFEDDMGGMKPMPTDPNPDQIKYCGCRCSGGGITFQSKRGTYTQNGGCDCSSITTYYNSFEDGRYDGTSCSGDGTGPWDRFGPSIDNPQDLSL